MFVSLISEVIILNNFVLYLHPKSFQVGFNSFFYKFIKCHELDDVLCVRNNYFCILDTTCI